jgi:hypothetical protein
MEHPGRENEDEAPHLVPLSRQVLALFDEL